MTLVGGVRLAILDGSSAGELLTLQRAAFVGEARAHNDLGIPPLTESLAAVHAEVSRPDVLTVGWRSESGRLVAAVKAAVDKAVPHVAHIGRLMVAPDLQGHGLGPRLLEALDARLPAAVTELHLFTGEFSVENLRLYARLGYKEVGRKPIPAGYDLVYLVKERSVLL